MAIFSLVFQALSLALCVPFGVGLALVLARLHHRQAVFPAQPVTGSPDIGIPTAIGSVLALVHHIHGAKNDVIMQMPLIYVGGDYIGIFPAQHFIGKPAARSRGPAPAWFRLAQRLVSGGGPNCCLF